jgi:UDP-glucose 4-epimerase
MITLEGATVLVTGGAGFVGSRIVRELVARGSRVTVLDDFSTGTLELLPPEGTFRLVRGSVTDLNALREAGAGATVILHAAARNIIASTANPYDDFETNVRGTLNVLTFARETNPARVVYCSSASVYGNPVHLPINEDDPVSTLSPYSVSKLAGENYGRAFYESYDLPTTALRYSNVYGPHQSPGNPYCGVVSRFIAAALEGRPLSIHGDGEQTRDFTFVDDVVDATLRAATSPRAEGLVFNVATGIETSVRRLAELVLEATGSRSPIESVDRRDIDNIRRRVLSIERARRILRWSPVTNLSAGLRQTVEWIRGGARA